MRKIILITTGLLLTAVIVKAQCDTKTTWIASKTDFLTADSTVHSKPGIVTITTDKKNFSLVTEDGKETLQGAITNYNCNWQDSTNGNISFKSDLNDKQGKLRHATITIEAKDGKVTMFLEAEEEQTKIRLPVDNYEVSK